MPRFARMPLGCLAVLLLCTAAGRGAEPKPFREALVFVGGGFDPVTWVGLYDAAVDAGHPPDLIISTCGGSLAAGVIASFPDRRERFDFLTSHEFHDFMRSPRIVTPCVLNIFGRWCRSFLRSRHPCGAPPVFDTPVADVPCGPRPDIAVLHGPFPAGKCCPKVIMVAARMEYGPGQERCVHGRDKLFTEVYFTDPGTAPLLAGLPSAVGLQYPRSAVSPCTDVVAGQTLAKAMRASIADQYLMQPGHVDGHYYLTGGINLRPLELAHHLAAEVIFPFKNPLPFGLATFHNDVFQFDYNHRARQVNRDGFAHHWVDMSDFNQRHDLHLDPRLTHLGKLVEGVPDDHCRFVDLVRRQWQYAYDRAREAFQLPVNCKAHVRVRNSLR